MLLENKFDILTMSESWVDNFVTNLELEIPGYDLRRVDRWDKKGGGVCVYILQSYKNEVLSDISGISDAIIIIIIIIIIMIIIIIIMRHNAALKVLFWEMQRELQLSDTVPPWYSPAVPKPIYESPKAQAYWDIPVFAVSEQVKQNRVDARFIDHEKKKVLAVEMSCPWTENREKKQEEKTIKYGPLRWELKQQFPGYDIRQYNIIIDVLGGWSTEVDDAMRELFGARGGEILLRMQRAVISHTLNIARTLKVIS